MSLKPPVSDSDHRLGTAEAVVTLVEYGDYECPHCGRAQPIVAEVKERMGARLEFVFRHFPLSNVHPHAAKAAEAAEAAGVQGKFWEMHEALFGRQDALNPSDLVRRARNLRLDMARFEQELDGGLHADRVQRDFSSGVRSGVNGTPTFFINGQRHDDAWDADTLVAALNSAARPGR